MKALTEVNKKCVDAVVDGKACTHWGILKRLCWPSQFPHLKFCQHSPDKRIRYLTKKKTCTCYLLWQPWQSGCGVCHCVWINQWMVLYMGDNPAVLHLDWIQVKLGMLRFHCSWTISHLNLHTGFYNHADCSEANIRGKSWYWCTRVKSCTWVWSQDHLWKTSSWNWTHFYSVLSRSQKKRTLDFNSRPVTLLWIRSVEYKRWSGFELLKVCITFLIENKRKFSHIKFPSAMPSDYFINTFLMVHLNTYTHTVCMAMKMWIRWIKFSVGVSSGLWIFQINLRRVCGLHVSHFILSVSCECGIALLLVLSWPALVFVITESQPLKVLVLLWCRCTLVLVVSVYLA